MKMCLLAFSHGKVPTETKENEAVVIKISIKRSRLLNTNYCKYLTRGVLFAGNYLLEGSVTNPRALSAHGFVTEPESE